MKASQAHLPVRLRCLWEFSVVTNYVESELQEISN
jgi:hypothetical protein